MRPSSLMNDATDVHGLDGRTSKARLPYRMGGGTLYCRELRRTGQLEGWTDMGTFLESVVRPFQAQ